MQSLYNITQCFSFEYSLDDHSTWLCDKRKQIFCKLLWNSYSVSLLDGCPCIFYQSVTKKAEQEKKRDKKWKTEKRKLSCHNNCKDVTILVSFTWKVQGKCHRLFISLLDTATVAEPERPVSSVYNYRWSDKRGQFSKKFWTLRAFGSELCVLLYPLHCILYHNTAS